jgi:dTDP-4-dehydrorhamnose reductase
MRVLITGAAGMLGGDVVSACVERGHDVIPLAHGELDITESAEVNEALDAYSPRVIVNCAAWTDVDRAEDHEAEAMTVNSTGAGVLATAAARIEAAVLYPSSDYVFDGSSERPYVESNMPAPLSAYGRSKQGGETAVEVANPRHFVVRSSWLFGLGGKNFVETMLRLGNEESEVLVVSDQVGCPTYTRHLAAAIAVLIESDDYGIHHVAGSGSCSWYEFAQEIFDQANMECRVMAATTEMVSRTASRPPYSVLGSERAEPFVLPHWREGLAAYLAERELAGAGPAGAVA